MVPLGITNGCRLTPLRSARSSVRNDSVRQHQTATAGCPCLLWPAWPHLSAEHYVKRGDQTALYFACPPGHRPPVRFVHPLIAAATPGGRPKQTNREAERRRTLANACRRQPVAASDGERLIRGSRAKWLDPPGGGPSRRGYHSCEIRGAVCESALTMEPPTVTPASQLQLAVADSKRYGFSNASRALARPRTECEFDGAR
jgi:hypothetical protein